MAEETMEKHNHKKLVIIIFFAVLLLSALVARFIKIPISENQEARKYDVSIEGNFWIGSAKPAITIIEFSDFECPYCKNSATTLETLRALYPGKLKIVYKDYIGHNNSYALALAARCAGEQGLFWPIHDELFFNQENVNVANFSAQLSAIGADQARFDRCYKGEYYKEQIKKDDDEAIALEVSGTPTSFVNSYIVKGDISLENWKLIVDKLLETYDTN
ncbi:MAG: thioredoxin domain-containing protein [Patescibacteria group bacterium]|jgi:protein-disulfide isomerase